MPPVMPSQGGGRGGARGPSNFDKWKMGAMMGGSVGTVMGFVYGCYHIMRFGGGQAGPMRLLGQYMVGTGVTFGFFMSIGSVIRTEGRSRIADRAYFAAQRQPIVLPATRSRTTGGTSKERRW